MLIKLPEGVEIALNLYIVGTIDGEETPTLITVSGLTSFTDTVADNVELSHIIASNKLDEVGSDWRVMTRAEIADYKKREADHEQFMAL